MPFISQMISDEVDRKLFSLGIFPQENGALAVAERLPRYHDDECVYIEKFDSIIECVKYLKKNIEELKDNFLSMWNDLDGLLDDMAKSDSKNMNCFSEDLRDMFLYRLSNLCYERKSLEEYYNKIEELDSHSETLSNYHIKILGYYSTMLAYVSAELCIENKRLIDIDEFTDKYGEYKIRKLLKIAYHSGVYGRDGGIGYKGLTSPLTPFGNYDYFQDRVMDGTTINDKSGGFATEKFLEYNKFRRNPDLLKKKYFNYRVKPLRYLKRKLKCKKNNKNGNKKERLNVSTTGLVYVDSKTDPENYYWWDQQRNNPYLFDSRDTDGVYPTWKSYDK